MAMRLVVLLATALLGAMILYSQSPEAVPAPIRAVFASAEGQLRSVIAPAPKAVAAHAPVAAASPALPHSGAYLYAGLAAAALVVGSLFTLRNRRREIAPPAWIVAARAAAPEGRKPRDHQAECAQIEKLLVPDIRTRGIAALGRAHQLDLYWRYVSRSKPIQSGSASGDTFEEWRKVTLATLKTVTPIAGERTSAAFRDARSSLSVLAKDDNVAIRAFYDALAARARDEAAAWKEAKAAILAVPAEQAKCLAAMERLREVHRGTAKDAAALVGELEVSVRAVL